MGLLHSKINNKSKALDYLIKALELFEKNNHQDFGSLFKT